MKHASRIKQGLIVTVLLMFGGRGGYCVSSENSNLEFTVRGLLSISNKALFKTNIFTETIPFVLDRRANFWRLGISRIYSNSGKSTSSATFITYGYEGGDIYSVARKITITNSESILVLTNPPPVLTNLSPVQASITPGPEPIFLGWHRLIWFAFVGHQTTGVGTEGDIPPPWHAPPGELLHARFDLLPEYPQLPGRVLFFKQADQPQIVARYEVTRTIKFNTLTLPTEFFLTISTRLPGAEKAPVIGSVVHGVVLDVGPCTTDTMIPHFQDPVLTLDYRFKNLEKGIHDLAYVTNKWLARDDQILQQQLEEFLNVPRARKRAADHWIAMRNAVLLLLVILGLAPLVTLLRKRSSITNQNPK